MAKYSLDTAEAILGADGYATSAGWLTIYQSSGLTREYIGATQEYLMEGIGLPASAYADAPILPTDDSLAVRRTEDGTAWEMVTDLRGQTAYSKQTGQPELISDMGDLPDDLTLLVPATPYDKWDGNEWVTDTDAQNAAEVAEVEKELNSRIQEAEETIDTLKRAVKYDMATEEEKKRLEEWEKYSVQLMRVNPGDNWPPKPE